jgi:hypothetical protein
MSNASWNSKLANRKIKISNIKMKWRRKEKSFPVYSGLLLLVFTIIKFTQVMVPDASTLKLERQINIKAKKSMTPVWQSLILWDRCELPLENKIWLKQLPNKKVRIKTT